MNGRTEDGIVHDEVCGSIELNTTDPVAVIRIATDSAPRTIFKGLRGDREFTAPLAGNTKVSAAPSFASGNGCGSLIVCHALVCSERDAGVGDGAVGDEHAAIVPNATSQAPPGR